MLDINAWSGFAGEKAEYAIGGPTIELFFNSYNKKYGTNYVAKSTSSTGYLVGNGSATGYQLTLSVNNDNLYVLNSQERANEMWLASPISDFQYYIMSVSYNGNVGNTIRTSTSSGFRPIVCLKSDVKLQDENGTYTIK